MRVKMSLLMNGGVEMSPEYCVSIYRCCSPEEKTAAHETRVV
jgi:hypothetical protein